MDDSTLYKIQYWELPGSMKASDYSFRYCFGSTAAIYMFDTSRKQTFDKIDTFLQQT